MKYTDNAINVLTAISFRGIGRASIVKSFTGGDTVEDIVHKLCKYSKRAETITLDNFLMRKSEILNKLQSLEGFADGVVAIGDKDFPPLRGTVKQGDRPVFLFYRGDLSLLNITNNIVAVIGLRNPDRDIENIEREVVSELVKKGAIILSGLALGCDSIAHKQALTSAGKTVAILPSPLNDIVPRQNRELADEIVKKGGLLISEYYIEAKSKLEGDGRYQERDRLQALFSDCIILSASYSKDENGSLQKNDSGSRLAMGYAVEYLIPRAVIYDEEISKDNPKFDLNRKIIDEYKETIIINRKNLSEKIKLISSLKPLPDKQLDEQLTLMF